MDEQTVRTAIRSLIDRNVQRADQLRDENKGIQEDEKPVRYRVNKENIARLEFSTDVLIELEHKLRLCGCPDEAYES